MELKINPKQFYTVGIYSFIVIAVFNFLNFLISFSKINLFSKIAMFAGIIFNVALVLFFNYLRSMEPVEETLAQSDDIDEIIKEISKGKKKK